MKHLQNTGNSNTNYLDSTVITGQSDNNRRNMSNSRHLQQKSVAFSSDEPTEQTVTYGEDGMPNL